MGKLLAGVVIAVVAGGLGYQAYRLNAQRLELQGRVDEAEAATAALTAEQEQVSADLDYYADAQNLGKATRALDNFRAPGETLFIIVPEGKPDPATSP